MGRYSGLVRRLGHHRWFAALGPRIVPLDRAIQRATRGRLTIAGRHGLPALLLTTRGARTGRPRTVPLLYAPHGRCYVVAASNWGRPAHPAWSANLLAHPEATVAVGRRTVAVRAKLLEGAERDRMWALLTEVWPAYDTYAERSGRDLRVFLLAEAPP